MRASFTEWVELARRTQQRALLQPFQSAKSAASSSGTVSYIRRVECDAQDLVQTSQPHERRGATNQLGGSSLSALQMTWVLPHPNSCTSDTFANKMQKSHVAFLSFSRRRDGQSNSTTCGGNSSSAVSSCKNMTRSISNGCRMISSSSISSRRAVDSGCRSWNLAFYSTAAVETETTQGAPCASKQSATFSNEEETGHRRAHMQASVRQESGMVYLADISYVTSVEEGSRDVTEKKEKYSLSEERSQISSDLVHPSEQGSSTKNTTAASDSMISSANATPMRFIRVNRPGSARRPGCSQASSSGVTTCSLNSAGEHERPTEQPPQQCGKRNHQEDSGHAAGRSKTKEKEFCCAKNAENNKKPSSPCRRQVQGKEEEFGFKYEGPEPTTHGDWSHKGRVTDF